MAESIMGLFSSAPSIERVNIFGLIVMLAAVLLAVFSGKLALLLPETKRDTGKIVFKLASLPICVIGFAIAVF